LINNYNSFSHKRQTNNPDKIFSQKEKQTNNPEKNNFFGLYCGILNEEVIFIP